VRFKAEGPAIHLTALLGLRPANSANVIQRKVACFHCNLIPLLNQRGWSILTITRAFGALLYHRVNLGPFIGSAFVHSRAQAPVYETSSHIPSRPHVTLHLWSGLIRRGRRFVGSELVVGEGHRPRVRAYPARLLSSSVSCPAETGAGRTLALSRVVS
jgi:hypothetical protein